jgi:hypothetical protein
VNEDVSSIVPTYIDGVSLTLNAYQKAVETLLDQDSCPGASIEELELFKSQFRTSAFTCRLRSCPRATIGFKTDHLRREHEIGHTGGFRCTFLGCQYPPLRSSKALTAHTKSSHCHLIPLPRKCIRRVGHLSERLTSSPPSSSRNSSKSKISGPACSECFTKNLRCNKALPTCATCKRWSRVCTYPDSCEQCVLKNLRCDKSQPICKACKSSSIICSYDDSTEKECDISNQETAAVRLTNDPEEMTGNSKRKHTAVQEPMQVPSISEAQLSGSDLLGSSGIGVGYLDIILNEFTGGTPINSGLFERIKATFTNNIHACWELAEMVDNPTAGSVDALAPDKIISQLWSKHPELARELHQLVVGENESQSVIKSVIDYEQSDIDHESDDDATLNQPLHHCFCNKETSGNMIACDNPTCPREWFHLYCVNLVVTPQQGEKWFCGDNCRKADEKVTFEEQDGA